jgi:predicted dehydrogenase
MIDTAVIGTGYLGRFHAEKYARLDDARLVAVCDTDVGAAAEVARRLDTRAVADHRELLGRVQAVSIVVPTHLHHAIARDFLQAGADVLIEKPMTATVAEADELIDLATRHGRILQVGHLERFNRAVQGLHEVLDRPRFIESHRLAPFKPRGTDVSVILDLMIHDIDIILDVVGSPLAEVRASGVPVLTGAVDIANARLEFADGCVANVTASRISLKSERRMRIFQPDAYLALDFQERVLSIHRKGGGEQFPGIPEIESEQYRYDEADALLEEIAHFLECVRTRATPLVSGEDGRRALATAVRIAELLENPSP